MGKPTDRLNTLQGKGHYYKAPAARLKQARLQSLPVEDPSTQFCADPADCQRNSEYFFTVRNPECNLNT